MAHFEGPAWTYKYCIWLSALCLGEWSRSGCNRTKDATVPLKISLLHYPAPPIQAGDLRQWGCRIIAAMISVSHQEESVIAANMIDCAYQPNNELVFSGSLGSPQIQSGGLSDRGELKALWCASGADQPP